MNPRDVNPFEEEEEFDIAAVQKEIEELEGQLSEVRGKMAAFRRWRQAMTATVTTNCMVLRGVSWTTYQALTRDLESGKRLTYDRGTLEIMAPLPPHERYKSRLSRMVEVTTEETETEIASLGSTTWKREDLQRGLEPDACFYIQNEGAIRGKDEIDLSQDPPPDLAIEVDNASSSLDRMAIYAALGVPEVWRFEGEVLAIFCLEAGEYRSQERSQVLPLLRREDILRFLQASQTMGETSWVRQFRKWVRENIKETRN